MDCVRHGETKFVRCEGLLEADVNGEIVALNIDRGQCYGLNEVASRVWQLLAHPVSVEDICTSLISEYSVEPDVCRNQVGQLVSELREEGMIRVEDNET